MEGRYAAYAYRGSRVRIHAEVMRTITAYHYFYSDRMRSWSQNKKAPKRNLGQRSMAPDRYRNPRLRAPT